MAHFQDALLSVATGATCRRSDSAVLTVAPFIGLRTGLSTTWSQNSRSQHRRGSCSRHEDRKPSEVFRTDLITAMKLHDSYQLNPDEYYVLADPWRQEWEKGVQVPVSPGTIPQPVARVVSEEKSLMFIRPKKYIVSSGSEPPELGYVDIRALADGVCRYDLNDMDAAWLELTNEEFKEMGMPELDEGTMERVLEEFEQRCSDNMNHAIETEEGLGIEYDEDVVCDVCQSPDGEDGNEMVFCDKCNICVHQCSVKNCRTAFHVTCAFDRGLEMKTILAENDEVKFKSYCPKHSSHRKAEGSLAAGAAQENGGPERSPRSPLEPFASLEQKQEEAHRVSVRKQKLQQLEDAFYTFVNLLDVARALRLPEEVVDFLYQYWKLKRKVNFNKPLITPKRDEEDNLAKREQDVLFRRLQLFTHLRQDLERVRNLTYMVTRREKIKRSVCKVQEQIFNLYTKLLEQERVSGVPSPSCSAASLESMLLFNSPSVGPDAPQIEDLKWHSAFFRKQMGTSLGRALKKPHPRAAGQAPHRAAGAPQGWLGFDKAAFADARLLAAPQRNGALAPDPGSRRDPRFPCDPGQGDGRDRPFRHKPLRAPDAPPRHPDPAPRAAAASGARREGPPKCNGALARGSQPPPAAKVPTTPASPGKNWGGFRIPKKGERPPQEAPAPGAACPCLGLGRGPARERAKSKPRADPESDGYAPDGEMSDSEGEASEKKCIPAAGGAMGRRTDFIRRSILAS
ncbi:protein Jade-1 isoform X6 [Pipistrellus kuhlii]|uniref:protein Jade-1 isoform X6 n=1 Tax=Pipistrellus kuhlii TaxID=59472 RepID=UPI001E272A90|nr:protein Jade-1 isoform X6 [Pipistrellus kuhlii]